MFLSVMCRPHDALSLDMCILCSKNSETNSHLFMQCEKLFFFFPPCLVFYGFAWLLWTVSLLLDIVVLGGVRKKLHFGKFQDLLFYVAYGWKGMLEFLNRFFSCWCLCGINFVYHLVWLKTLGFFRGISFD